MKIAIISDWFAEDMGYAENCLPRALAAIGHEVHLVTSDAQPYFNSEIYGATYEPFIGPGIVACGSQQLDGYTLHRLPHAIFHGGLRIQGLRRKLAELRPQIVQTFDVVSLTTLEAALCKISVGYKLFLESHLHASVFDAGDWKRRVYWSVYSATVGRAVSSLCEKCYPISTDSARIVSGCFGVQPSKINIVSLGVDTDLFRPPMDDGELVSRAGLRLSLGFEPSDVVCVYTGRFSKDKNPLCLARAIDRLAGEGLPFRGLFVGGGSPDEVASIRRCRGCVVQPFVPASKLPAFYWAADVGVWPSQESTSQLDAAASGLPLIISERVEVVERFEGNGLAYEEGSVNSLADCIRQLADAGLRRRMAEVGVRKMRADFSWRRIAGARTEDYAAALQR